MRTFIATFAALVCFAFNSILCRIALGSGLIDAAGFTDIRLASGAAGLLAILAVRNRKQLSETGLTGLFARGDWFSASFLFLYAICFSFAYLGLSTGTGALILFGIVQATMIAVGLFQGDRPGLLEWSGIFLALGGLVYLVFPGIESPPLLSSGLMAVSGIAWGLYSLRGRGSRDPVAETAGNFVRTLPFALIVTLPFAGGFNVSAEGAGLAVLSGAVASGIGYSIWYTALRGHTASSAAVVQLSVPVIAAIGGFIFLFEPLTLRLLISSVLILGGIGIAIAGRKPRGPKQG